MRRSEPQDIGAIIQHLKRATPLGEHMRAAEIWNRWHEIVGPALAAHSEPRNIRDRTLLVEVDSPVWMHRLSFQKWGVIRRVNRIMRKEFISDIYIQLRRDEEQTPPQHDV